MTLNDPIPRRGADYAKFEERLPTVKTTPAERLALHSTALRIIDDPNNKITAERVREAAESVFGAERAESYLTILRGDDVPNYHPSRREFVRLIGALYPYVPGETEEEKSDYIIREARPCFSAERWDNEVFPYIMERVAEYKAAGGTLDRWPDVVAEEGHNMDEEFFQSLDWLRSDPAGANAKVTKTLHEVNIVSESRMTMRADDLSDWPAQGDAHGVICMAIFTGDGWEGGKFDHVRADTRERDFKNVGDYLKLKPVSGEPVRLWLLSYDGRQATNVVEGIWP